MSFRNVSVPSAPLPPGLPVLCSKSARALGVPSRGKRHPWEDPSKEPSSGAGACPDPGSPPGCVNHAVPAGAPSVLVGDSGVAARKASEVAPEGLGISRQRGAFRKSSTLSPAATLLPGNPGLSRLEASCVFVVTLVKSLCPEINGSLFHGLS